MILEGFSLEKAHFAGFETSQETFDFPLKNGKSDVFQTLDMQILLRHIYMSEKSFLEILSEKIEKQVRADISQAKMNDFSREKASNNQTTVYFKSEDELENVDNYSENGSTTTLNDTVYNQWMNQIPLGKIQFTTPKQQVFGRIYPVNTPRPKKQPEPPPPRKKHVLTEAQKQAVVYFWGWQIRLQEDFTQPELKKAFRTLAHRLHPDKNKGTTTQFLELKSKYECLLSVF